MPLGDPPAAEQLVRFPARALAHGARLYRIHRADRSPWHFAGDGSGRFDLVGDATRGTCYAAERPLGAFVETFRDLALVSEAVAAGRRISEVLVDRPLRLADCTLARARGFGVTAAMHAGEDYPRTQAWAAAFLRAGFGGVRYRVSHDPAQRLIAVALFGPRGEPSWPVAATGPIGRGLARDAERRFGIRVRPRF